eukprot:evm.model.scf_130EXC.11 EVM.evm.TU.scf_130EXC.11   scf_130EXC:124873-129991(-)
MAFPVLGAPMLVRESWLATGKMGPFWPSFASSVVVAASVEWGAGPAAAPALCEALPGAAEVALKYSGFDRCPRVKTFGEVFHVRALAVMAFKNTSLSVLHELAPYIHEICVELRDAENEDREPNLAPMPSMWPALKRGLYLTARQASVTFVRWVMDWGVSMYCSASTALRLLTDYRGEVKRILADLPRLRRFVPLYMTTFNAFQTWVAADFSVSLALLTYKTMMMKGISWKDKRRFWGHHALHQGYKCIILSVVDPVGAVVGGVLFNSYAFVVMSYAGADLVAYNYLENALR